MIRVPFDAAVAQLEAVLLGRNVAPEKAHQVAYEMARNSLEGTYSHGINRFPRLVNNIDQGIIHTDAEPERISGFGAIENYDGNLGLGVVNAAFCMDRAIELARSHGIGLVAIRNTNHWQRAATYALQACAEGMAAMCFSNTMPNMPAWGAKDARIGNNPLTLAIPYGDGEILLDMAMSQFSYGALEVAKLAGRQMPIDAGFDEDGLLTTDPGAVFASRRLVPMGYWKGAALSMVLDVFAAGLSLGNSVAAIGQLEGDEHGISQVFIAIDYQRIAPNDAAQPIMEQAIQYALDSVPDGTGTRLSYPGHRRLAVTRQNLQEGIPVDEGVWAAIQAFTEK